MRALRDVPADELGRCTQAAHVRRQPAGRQSAGPTHLNDFVQVAQLRGALHKAMTDALGGLTHEVVAARVVDALGLEFADFAAAPDAVYAARTRAEKALRELVEYRLYLDLQRGWRITMPNLEQTGLLRVGYESLSEIAADQALWAAARSRFGTRATGIARSCAGSSSTSSARCSPSTSAVSR